jgi:cytochrome c peroxidase
MNTTQTLRLLPALSLLLACCGGGDAPGGSAAPAAPSAPANSNTPPAAQPAAQPAAPAAKKPLLPPKLDMTNVKAFFGADPVAPSSNNAVTKEKVALGKLLYESTALAGDGKVACATCHDPAHVGQDGRARSTGSGGKQAPRNTPTTWNASRQFAQGWDGLASTVEEFTGAHALQPWTFGRDQAGLLAAVAGVPELKQGFAQAFGGAAPDWPSFAQALGAYLRTLSTKSAFDEFLDGKNSALSTEQKWGLKLFMDTGCTNCHTSRLVGGNLTQKLGALRPFPSTDLGRYEVTKKEEDKFIFKAPPLLDVAKTGPYMHDGSIDSLPQIVKLMGQIQLSKELGDDDVHAIVAFLESLTGSPPADAPGSPGK